MGGPSLFQREMKRQRTVNSSSYATWKTSSKFHFKSCNYSSNYHTWKKIALPVTVDANISERWDNSEAIVATEEMKVFSTQKLKQFSLVQKVVVMGESLSPM